MTRKIHPTLHQIRGKLLTGSALLFVSATVVNGGNYLFNLILGRWLGPAAFADLSLIITLMLMVIFITATFQLTAVKFTAIYIVENDTARLNGLRRWLKQHAFLWGLALLIILAGGAPLWQRFFHTQSALPFVILGIGLPFYFTQGIDRGMLQGQMHFGRLASSYQAEMWVRLLTGVVFVAIGWTVSGATLSIVLSFAATWFIVGGWKRTLALRPTDAPLFTKADKRKVTLFAGPVIIAYLSQILINNSDILIVKRFFSSEMAGQYAALALIGRIVFFATWSVVTVLFPIVAQKHQRQESHRHLLFAGLGLVTLVSSFIIMMAWFVPEWIIHILFGEAYLAMAPLLWLYAVATMVYALANVMINYHLSLGHGWGTVFGIAAGVFQIVALSLFHESLLQVVIVQIVIMCCLLASLFIWDRWLTVEWRLIPNTESKSLSSSNLHLLKKRTS